MGTKRTPFQPDHTGKHNVPVHPGMEISHSSHAPSRQREHDAMRERGANHSGIDARVGSVPKNSRPVPIHGGMHRVVQGQPVTGGGHHASALDAVSGNTVVPGNVRTAPGWGNAGVQSGHPFAKAPSTKATRPVAVKPGMRSRTHPHTPELGRAMLAEAFRNSAADDRIAHRRGPDGHTLPDAVNEN